MSLDDKREALRRATAGRRGAGEDRPTENASDGITPADIVSWSGDPASEWLVVSWSEGGGRLVPVDTAPLRGSGDLDLSRAAGEPLVARCGLALDVPPETALRTVWKLPPSSAPRALDAVSACLDTQDDDSLALEIDESSLYLEHLRGVEAARDALRQAVHDGTVHESTIPASGTVVDLGERRRARDAPPHTPWGFLLAAAFALAALGLGLHSAHLDRQLEEAQAALEKAREARLFAGSDDQATLFIGTVRSSKHVTLKPSGSRVYLNLSLMGVETFPNYVVTWTDLASQETLHAFDFTVEDAVLDLPATEGTFELRVYGVAGDGSREPLDAHRVTIVTSEENLLR